MGVGSWHERMHHGRPFFPRLSRPLSDGDARCLGDVCAFARLSVFFFCPNH